MAKIYFDAIAIAPAAAIIDNERIENDGATRKKRIKAVISHDSTLTDIFKTRAAAEFTAQHTRIKRAAGTKSAKGEIVIYPVALMITDAIAKTAST